mmetsp:Transcript_4734/g.13222  ORF Transcript_4734/g.13222 Transcript_4734/m.13222 type:complete len:428 (+) Transcript_4734:277-1560(+)
MPRRKSRPKRKRATTRPSWECVKNGPSRDGASTAKLPRPHRRPSFGGLPRAAMRLVSTSTIKPVGSATKKVASYDSMRKGPPWNSNFNYRRASSACAWTMIFLYAGCDDGNVYDLSRNVPHVSYEIDESVNILWLDICDGVLAVSDDHGAVHMFNHENEGQWHHPASSGGGATSGWMVRCDDQAVYQGHSQGVTAYNIQTGRELWNTATASVLFGWQEQTLLFAGALDNKVHVLAKDSGKISVVCQCDSTVLSCASAEDGKYVFAGDDCSSIYCFDQAGERLWKLATTCGSAYSMQYYDDKVYIVTTDGVLACLDATETAIQDAKQGKVPTAKVVKADKAAVTTTADTAIESVQASAARKDGGVVVTCVPEGSKLRVRTEDDKYNATWNVQFPKNLRQAGAKFLVDELKESKNGGFYRAHGNIRRIV